MTERATRDRLSVVVPVYNEESGLETLYTRIVAVLEGLDADAEILFVDDGSTDGSRILLDALRQRDPRIAVIGLSRNFGKEIALTAGLDHAQGDAVVVIDADLQDPPELIPELVTAWRHGYDVVYARRTRRQGESALRRLTAFGFYRVMARLGSVAIPEDTGDFRLLSRRAVDALGRLRERHRFMKGLFAWIGYPSIGIPYEREPRASGRSSWNYRRLWHFAVEGLTSFSVAPLRIASVLGFAGALVAFVLGLIMFAKTLLYGEPVQGYPSLIVTITFLGGIQLLAIGILGEYLGRTFTEVKRRPLYLTSDYHPSAFGPARPRPPDEDAAG